MSQSFSSWICVVWLVMLFSGLNSSVLADDAVTRATLTFDEPVYVNMPVWVHIDFPADHSSFGSNLRYPYSREPWFFSINDFEVTLDGKPLPRLKHAGDTPAGWGGIMNGSAAPHSSPKGRLPLHLYYRFSKPGSYMVRYKGCSNWLARDKKIVADSEWTPVEVKPFSPEERSAWVQNQIAHQPEDVGLIVGDYLPSLLAQPDEQVLPVLLACLHHSDAFVQNYALNALDYYSDQIIMREIPQVIAKDGPTEALAYYLSHHRVCFQPVGEKLVDSVIPFMNSNSAQTVGAAVHTLVFMMPPLYEWKERPTVPNKIENAVWAAVPHIRKFKEREALWPLTLFMGKIKTNRAQKLLWQLADVPSVREQALICICWIKNPTDLKKLGLMLTSDDTTASSLPNSLFSAFGDAAIPYLLEGIKIGRTPRTVEGCIRQLVFVKSTEGYRLFKDALENDRPYKQAVVKILRSELSHSWQTSDADLLKLVTEELALVVSGHP